MPKVVLAVDHARADDHVPVWPVSPEVTVQLFLNQLGLGIFVAKGRCLVKGKALVDQHAGFGVQIVIDRERADAD